MRFLVYNIAYGTGSPGGAHKRLFTTHRYIRTGCIHFDLITEFVKKVNPDVIGLVEADTGSFRTGSVNQVSSLARELKHFHICDTKYGIDSPGRQIPILRNHANAILSAQKETDSTFHFFPNGVKKLIIEAEIDGIIFFIVHLSLRRQTRAMQFEHLMKIVPKDRPVVIAGDFNTYGGEQELWLLKKTLRLRNANVLTAPTYPSWKPKHQLDFILCSEELEVMSFEIPLVEFSDHLPLIVDFRKK